MDCTVYRMAKGLGITTMDEPEECREAKTFGTGLLGKGLGEIDVEKALGLGNGLTLGIDSLFTKVAEASEEPRHQQVIDLKDTFEPLDDSLAIWKRIAEPPSRLRFWGSSERIDMPLGGLWQRHSAHIGYRINEDVTIVGSGGFDVISGFGGPGVHMMPTFGIGFIIGGDDKDR